MRRIVISLPSAASAASAASASCCADAARRTQRMRGTFPVGGIFGCLQTQQINLALDDEEAQHLALQFHVPKRLARKMHQIDLAPIVNVMFAGMT
ncbi:MAG: hypothetical protein R3D43_00360 [Tepidamorphaceae bacterium]